MGRNGGKHRQQARCFKTFKTLIKDLNGNKTTNSKNQAINFNGKPHSNAKKMANAFNMQYSSVKLHKRSKTARKTTKQLKRLSDLPPPILEADTIKAIKSSKASKALGPNQLSPLHLKHQGRKGITFLTQLFNLSVTSSKVPSIWKMSTIAPLLKPNRPAQESSSSARCHFSTQPSKYLKKKNQHYHSV